VRRSCRRCPVNNVDPHVRRHTVQVFFSFKKDDVWGPSNGRQIQAKLAKEEFALETETAQMRHLWDLISMSRLSFLIKK
jgi:hypothetical protein